MKNISSQPFTRRFNHLYNMVQELSDLFDDLSYDVLQSCICADAKPFQDTLDSDELVKSKFDTLLTCLEDYRNTALKAYSSL